MRPETWSRTALMTDRSSSVSSVDGGATAGKSADPEPEPHAAQTASAITKARCINRLCIPAPSTERVLGSRTGTRRLYFVAGRYFFGRAINAIPATFSVATRQAFLRGRVTSSGHEDGLDVPVRHRTLSRMPRARIAATLEGPVCRERDGSAALSDASEIRRRESARRWVLHNRN